jgi:hypothetical protein
VNGSAEFAQERNARHLPHGSWRFPPTTHAIEPDYFFGQTSLRQSTIFLILAIFSEILGVLIKKFIRSLAADHKM